MRNIIMEKRVGVVNQEAATLTSLENESMWCPSSEHLARITKMERIRNGSKTFLTRLGVSNGFPVFDLNTAA